MEDRKEDFLFFICDFLFSIWDSLFFYFGLEIAHGTK